MARRDLLLENVAHTKGRGLEIGPLMAPTLTKQNADIYFLDHASTEDLREKYRHDPAVSEDLITEVDFVWGEQTMAEVTKSAAPFDFVIAAHVLEHVPDLCGWLREVSAVLRPGGRLSLCLPDRRFSFDVRRSPSDISDVVEAALLSRRRPSVRSTFDHFYRHVDVDTVALWHGLPGHDDPPFNAATAMDFAERAATTDNYIDTHCWVFSDADFLDLLRRATELHLVDLRIVSFHPTAPNELEFFVTMERLVDGVGIEQRRELCLAAIDEAQQQDFPELLSLEPPEPEPRGIPVHVSERELRMIESKRKLFTLARGLRSARWRR